MSPFEKVILPCCYFPNIDWILAAANADEVFIEKHENFSKQTYRNRMRILSANGVQDLILPVLNKNSKEGITQMQVNHDENWAWNHWHSVKSAYGKSPYFEYYEHHFEAFFRSAENWNLWQINLNSIQLSFNLLKLDLDVEFTKEFKAEYGVNGDLRKQFKPSKHPQLFHQEKYLQVFADRFDFKPNLSVLDLLFNLGPQSLAYILKQELNPYH
ncbi:WbqC family protein [Luteibaculum oceani]|uniref:WbqC family protein n=1 Tax=Luteibaculum oceani TaxID=1294296 RepID=UPI001476A03C|nr:WbqC family protein [Luteibaculum oceani]